MTQLDVRITCPSCGHVSEETIPVNCCVVFYQCPGCRLTLKPKAGDCCVFCSYGDHRCPPMQTDPASDTSLTDIPRPS